MLRERGMSKRTPHARPLPHHRLVAYHVALELLGLVRDANIRDPKLRDQALRAAKSVCLNVAEAPKAISGTEIVAGAASVCRSGAKRRASGRTSPADKARVFGIARGEALEVAAAIEIAHVAGDVDAHVSERCAPLADRLYALLTGLSR